MKNKIFACIFAAVLIAYPAFAEKYFVLSVNHISDSLTFNSINLEEIDRAFEYNDKSGFLVKTVSFDNTDIKKIYYQMPENRNYNIYLPYDKSIAKIIVYNPSSSIVMDLDIASFADTCGNGICEPYESYENCEADCASGSKDDFCDELMDNVCDPDCIPGKDTDCTSSSNININDVNQKATELQTNQIEETKQEESTSKPNYFMRLSVIAGIVVLIITFLLLKKIKQNRVSSSLKQYISDNIRNGFTLQQIKDALFKEGYKEKEIDKAVKSI